MTAKLTYFNIPGLGEPVRLMLSGAKIPFEDKRITLKEWEILKPKLKWPHLPMLEMDGKILFQSMSICRYIAKQANLAGSNADDALLADMTVDALEDMRQKVVRNYFSLDSPERDQSLKNATEAVVPFYMKNFDDQLAENDGFLVHGKLTWADIIFMGHADYMSHILNHDTLAKFPKLKEHMEKIMQLPGIKEYLESRPKLPVDIRQWFMFSD